MGRWTGAAEGMRKGPECCTEPGENCKALPVSPLGTYPYKTQIHRSGACNDKTTTNEQHRTDNHMHEETHTDGPRRKDTVPRAWECRLGVEISQDTEEESQRNAGEHVVLKTEGIGNVRQENRNNGIATWTAWHDLLKDWNNEMMRL